MPGMGGGGGTLPTGNTPPTAAITQPVIDVFLENGESTTINYRAQSAEEAATLQIFLDRDSNQSNGNEIVLATGINVPAGATGITGSAVFSSTGVVNATYRAYGRVSDGVNAPVLVVSAASIVVAPPGSRPRDEAPTITMLEPVPNLGLSSQDQLTVQYAYTDPDSPVTVTLLLDKDRNPNNDDISNPGDPADPATNIIILPNAARNATDPTFPPDPPPPDNPQTPPTQPDSVQIRTNPRVLPQTVRGAAPPVKTYLFTIDFSRIPPRSDGLPYFIRATISDGTNPRAHSYAAGSLTITSLARGTVDLARVGFSIAGARFYGFSTGEFLGTNFTAVGDIDGDTVEDMLLVSRYGSPRNRFQTGAAYLFFGRRKTPFPPDSNANGTPDFVDAGGNLVEFATPPLFIFNPAFVGVSPYDPRVVGRFGGQISVNSVGALVAGSFYRGVTYLMPAPNGGSLPPTALQDADHPGRATSGLMSVARVSMTGNDGSDTAPNFVPDFVFGVPFVSTPTDGMDDDPCDMDGGSYSDGLPGDFSSQAPGDDHLDSSFYETGLALIVSGSNDIANTFRQFVDAARTGQQPDRGDDEGIISPVPVGARLRGAWFPSAFGYTLQTDNQFGREVARIQSLDNDDQAELAISAPGFNGGDGAVGVWAGTNMLDSIYYTDANFSLPAYQDGDCQIPTRTFAVQPVQTFFRGKPGDELSSPRNCGDYNQDGTNDLMMGAPSRDGCPSSDVDCTDFDKGLIDNGALLIFQTPVGGYGEVDLGVENLPRVEIRGIHDGDRFGEVQDQAGDMNGDGIADIVFASPNYDDDNRFNLDAGFVGVLFGNRFITGEQGYQPEQVGTPALPGFRLYGATVGARAGASVASAGDFNRDGFGDLLIASPGERRLDSTGQFRRGVAYLILGSPRLGTPGFESFNLSEVGSDRLPGLVFLSPYVDASASEAPMATVASVGDVDGDGFDDIIFGLPRADFVFPNSPGNRRSDAGEAILVYGNNLRD